MADNISGNPWKGLNFYVEGEILFGRNAEILSLSQYIFNNTQTVLYGRSGIGKSSILNAGIFPKAREQGMIPISIRLKHDDENNYLDQIKAAFISAGLTFKNNVEPANGKNDVSIWEFVHRTAFVDTNGEEKIPLLVFDQFEEIFSLQKNENIKRDFFKQLGNLLNDVKPDYIVEHESLMRQKDLANHETKIVSTGAFKGLSIKLTTRRSDNAEQVRNSYIEHPDYHIVFALREDFLSSLELYTASIPVMKDNRFGLLPINEEQAADIIRLPRQGLVDNDVTKLIIEQVTGRTDFILDGIPEIEVDAAVLSLFLSRLYEKKDENVTCVTADLVNTYSGHIIHDFYSDSTSSVSDKGEIIRAETILLLEDQLLTREGRRNNVSRSDLIALGASEEELDILTNSRKLLRQFHHGNDIRIEYIHDILCPVVKDRKEQREIQRQQEEEKQRIINKGKKNNTIIAWLMIYFIAMLFIVPNILTEFLGAIWAVQQNSGNDEIPNCIIYITQNWGCGVNVNFPLWKQVLLIYSQIVSMAIAIYSLLYLVPKWVCKFIDKSKAVSDFIKVGVVFFLALYSSSEKFLCKFVDNLSLLWLGVFWILFIIILLYQPKKREYVA